MFWAISAVFALSVAWALLVLSTMLVKQHYLFDAITGLIIGAVVWKAWFAPVFSQTTR